MISKPLSIRFKFSTIIGCYDIHEAVGKSTKGRPQSSVITEAIDALIEGMRLEGKIPSYNTDGEVEERIDEIFDVKPYQSDGQKPLVLPSASLVPATIEEESSTSSEVRKAIDDVVGIVESETKSLDSPMELPSEKSEEAKKEVLTFEAIEAQTKGDKLVEQCKGDKVKEYARSIVYANISPDLRGTDTATRVFNQTLSLIMKDKKPEGEDCGS